MGLVFFFSSSKRVAKVRLLSIISYLLIRADVKQTSRLVLGSRHERLSSRMELLIMKIRETVDWKLWLHFEEYRLTKTELTSASCPKKVWVHLSVRTSHSLMDRSTEPVTTRFCSILSPMEQTSPAWAGVWSSFFPDSKSQTVSIMSPDPVMIFLSIDELKTVK